MFLVALSRTYAICLEEAPSLVGITTSIVYTRYYVFCCVPSYEPIHKAIPASLPTREGVQSTTTRRASCSIIFRCFLAALVVWQPILVAGGRNPAAITTSSVLYPVHMMFCSSCKFFVPGIPIITFLPVYGYYYSFLLSKVASRGPGEGGVGCILFDI